MQFLTDRSGQSMIEWLVVAVIIVAVVGAVLLAIFATLSGKLQAVNDSL
jgi:Flp pilus assembly pilin Flp